MKKVISGTMTLILTLMGLVALSFASIVPASAVPDLPDKNYTTICHSNGDGTYKPVFLYKYAIVHNTYLNLGHGEHADDIVPPFSGDSGTFEKNWTSENEAVFEKFCSPVREAVCTPVVITPAVAAVPAVPAVEEVSHMEKGELITPAVEAVPSQWWNWAPNKEQGPFDGPPSFPNDERGTWNGPHTNGGPDQEKTGTFNNSNGENGRASWFHREAAIEGRDAVYGPDVKVIDVEASPGTPESPAVPEVLGEECVDVPQEPTFPEEPNEPITPVVPVPPHGEPNPGAPVVPVTPETPVTAEQTVPVPAETTPVQPQDEGQLANTGAEDLVLPAGIALLILLAGGGLVLASRRIA
jgi:hypothetical protein